MNAIDIAFYRMRVKKISDSIVDSDRKEVARELVSLAVELDREAAIIKAQQYDLEGKCG
jgi:hypothetical protein